MDLTQPISFKVKESFKPFKKGDILELRGNKYNGARSIILPKANGSGKRYYETFFSGKPLLFEEVNKE